MQEKRAEVVRTKAEELGIPGDLQRGPGPDLQYGLDALLTGIDMSPRPQVASWSSGWTDGGPLPSSSTSMRTRCSRSSGTTRTTMNPDGPKLTITLHELESLLTTLKRS